MAHNDEAAYPYFEADASGTGKADMLRAIKKVCLEGGAGMYDLLRRIINTDLTLLTDGATTSFDELP